MVENVRVRCAAHNRYMARHYFGTGYVRTVAMKRECYGRSKASQ
jgi:hypothetical protein